MKKRKVILLVCPPGDLQIGLQALIKAHFDADVLAVGDSVTVSSVANKQNPDLILIDQDTRKDQMPKLVKELKTLYPTIRCIVLVNDDLGHLSFMDTGADLIVTKGLPGLKLIDEITKFFLEERE